MSDLADVETQHGFVFGGGPAVSGQPVAVVQCVTPTCKHRNQQVQVFEDHATPVHCGGCSTVLHCVHEYADAVRHEGTLGAPVEVRESVCRHCGDVSSAERKPVLIRLQDLPVSALSSLFG
jgi:uncharacterized repeat protein (TIGR04076 family)